MHPYKDMEKSAYWKTGVSDVSALEFADIFRPKIAIAKATRIAAAGSCFAQHIGAQFKERGFGYLDKEKAPPMMDRQDYARFGFDIYSARYGNVYSMRQMVQLLQRARGEVVPVEKHWQDGARWFDPFRPAIQPDGYDSADELDADVAFHLSRVLSLINAADLFVFTFGLTEGWTVKADGMTLPTCRPAPARLPAHMTAQDTSSPISPT